MKSETPSTIYPNMDATLPASPTSPTTTNSPPLTTVTTPPRTRHTAIAAAMDQSRLVSPPAMAMQVVSAASKPDCRIEEISALLSHDPALCAKLLKTVNSCVFALAHPVASIDRAVLTIGLRPLRSLVLGLSIPVLQKVPKPDPALRAYWLSSVGGAIMARELSVLRRYPNPDADMVAGLLRDIGTMLLQKTYPNDWARVQESSVKDLLESQCDIEEQMIGVNHADLSAELLRSWNFPEDVVEAIRYHHAPEQLSHARHALSNRAELLYFADMLTKIDQVVQEPTVFIRLLQFAKTHFGLDRDSLTLFLERVTPLHMEFANSLDLNVGFLPDYAAVMNQGCEALVKLTVESVMDQSVVNPQETTGSSLRWPVAQKRSGSRLETTSQAGNSFRSRSS